MIKVALLGWAYDSGTQRSSHTPHSIEGGLDDCDLPEPSLLVSPVFNSSDLDKKLGDNLFLTLYSNCTSFGHKVQDYIFTPYNLRYVHACAFTEAHIPHTSCEDRRCNLSAKGFRAHITPAEPTSAGGTHGGEIVCTKKHIDSSCVDNSVYDTIANVTGVPCRIAAMYIRLCKLIVVIVTAYFWAGLGPAEDNFNISGRLTLLRLSSASPLYA